MAWRPLMMTEWFSRLFIIVISRHHTGSRSSSVLIVRANFVGADFCAAGRRESQPYGPDEIAFAILQLLPPRLGRAKCPLRGPGVACFGTLLAFKCVATKRQRTIADRLYAFNEDICCICCLVFFSVVVLMFTAFIVFMSACKLLRRNQ